MTVKHPDPDHFSSIRQVRVGGAVSVVWRTDGKICSAAPAACRVPPAPDCRWKFSSNHTILNSISGVLLKIKRQS